ncbi:hypothetical protein AHAS_Ahas15G0303600 [Arachis hypogaea]
MKKEVVREENNYGNLHSNEAESCIEGEFIELPIEEVLDEGYTPPITQHPSPEIREVKAIKKSTNKGTVTKKQKTIFMKKRRSTKINPTLTPTSKVNQANNNKRKLIRRNSNPRALIFSSPPLGSFLSTNWKKRKKIRQSSVKLMMLKKRLLGGNTTLSIL